MGGDPPRPSPPSLTADIQGAAWELPPSPPPLAVVRREAVAAVAPVAAADARLFLVGVEKSKNDDFREMSIAKECEPTADVVPGGANAGVGAGCAARSKREDIGSVAVECGEEVSIAIPWEDKEEAGEEWIIEKEEEGLPPPADEFCERDAGADADGVVAVAAVKPCVRARRVRRDRSASFTARTNALPHRLYSLLVKYPRHNIIR